MTTRNADIWRRIYDEVKEMGQLIKDSTPDAQGYNKLPLIGKKEREDMFRAIEVLQKRASSYVDTLNIQSTPIKWRYNREDPTTHASQKSFAYKHLMTEEQISAYGDDFMKHERMVSNLD